ncbi:MAG: T9SS type A sorting domain-containing protein [Flavobacterium sp.]|nr:T9SS type A sorting domain-containing protein [Flavobacterium sp.]
MVFVSRRPKAGEQLTPSDNQFDAPQNRTPASYWITNPNNYFENNVAAGTEGTGFWFAFPQNGPMFASKNIPYYSGMVIWNQPLGRFNGFVAHTCMSGWDVFDRLNDDHSIDANWGWKINTRQLIQNGMFYGNDQALYCGLGVDGINENTVFYNCTFSDNKTATMLAGNLTIENSLFNSDSDLGVFNGTREFFRFYDGPGQHINCHFTGWNKPNAEMIKQIDGGGATENFSPSFRGTTTDSQDMTRFRFATFQDLNDVRARKVGQFFKDYDGGLLGKPHTTLIRDIPFLRDGHEYRHSSWSNAARSDYYFASLWLHNIDGTGTQISVQRTKPGTANACLFDKGEPASGTFKFPLIVNQGFTYTYYFSQAPSSKKIHLIYNRGDAGDIAFVNFKGLGKLAGFNVSGSNINRLNSKADVENSSNLAYFIDQNGDVYVKLKALGGDDRVNVFFNWTGNGSYNVTPLPCTNNDFTPIINIPANIPPVASFTSPTQTQYEVGTSLGVVVNATDSDGTISNVKLFVNDVLVRQEGAAPYEWGTVNPNANDTALLNLTAGTYTLKAIATDNLGASTTVTKTITVSNANIPPTVTFTTPAQSQYEVGTSIGVVVNATDSDGTISNVKLLINDVLVRQENASPYEWGTANPNANDIALQNITAGTYVLKAIATDNLGAITTVTKTITVYNKTKIVHIKKRDTPGYAIDGNFNGADGQNVYLWSGNPSNVNQQWIEIDRGNGYYSYQKVGTNVCIDGNNGGTNNQNVYLWTCNDTNLNQQWKKIDMGSGYFRLEKRNASSYSIDGGFGGVNGQNVKLYTSSTNQSMQWSITTVNIPLTTTRLEEGTFSIYPNPVIDEFTFDIKENEIEPKTIGKIYNNSGIMIQTFEIDVVKPTVSIRDLKPGIYLLYVEGKNKPYSTKIIKQ